MCLPQGKHRTAKEKAEFSATLPNVNLSVHALLAPRLAQSPLGCAGALTLHSLSKPSFRAPCRLYLGLSVLALMFDKTYMERFWPQLEAWLAFMRASESGLVSTPEKMLRCTVECLLDTPVWFSNALKDRWLHCNAARAHTVLSEPWVLVTNQSDKEVQLYKISHLDFMARRHVNQQKGAAAKASPASPTLAASSSGGVTLMQKVAQIKQELDLNESLSTATAIKQANEVMGLEPDGPLPAQVEALLGALGIAP